MTSRRLRTLGLVVVIAFAVGGWGCTASRTAKPPAKKSSEPYRVEKEGTIPPLTQSEVRKEADQEVAYEDLPATEDTIQEEDVPPDAAPVAPAPVTPAAPAPSGAPQRMMDGFRIQIFASGNEASAQSVREAAEARVGAPAYVVLIEGVYKVRVGDCPSRSEAEVLLKKCRDAGYGDAWIASSRIVMPERKDGS